MENRLPDQLLQNIKRDYSRLRKLLKKANSHWHYEDYIYRFYHGSFKVYGLQHETKNIVEALKQLAPEGFTFCSTCQDLVKKGAGNKQ